MNRLVHNLSLDAGFSKRADGLIYSPYKEEYDITEELHDFAKLIVLEHRLVSFRFDINMNWERKVFNLPITVLSNMDGVLII